MQSPDSATTTLINNLNTALVMVDENLNIVYANHAGEALLCLSACLPLKEIFFDFKP